jgi:DNA-directed RNA polymerase specialized sigma subunit
MIRLLPEPQQEVVELTFFKGLTQREIAAKKSMGWAQ